MSTASDSFIDDWTDCRRGYPGWTPDCADNVTNDNSKTIVDSVPGVYMHKTDGEIQSTPAGYVKYDTSSAKGMSGGPHYYCPYDTDHDGDYCEDGHWITGVTHGYYIYWFFGYHGYVSGVKARDIRDWVIANTP